MFDRVSPLGVSIGRQAVIRQTQAEIGRLSGQMASGKKADPAKDLGPGAAILYQLHADARLRQSINTTTEIASLRMETMQTALENVADVTTQISGEVIKVASLKGVGMKVLAAQAREAMAETVDLLNTQHDGKAVFAGSDSDGTPMKGTGETGGANDTIASVLAAAVAANGGPIDVDDVNTLLEGASGLNAVFSDTHPDTSLRYQGAFFQATDDGLPTKVRIGIGESLSYDFKANHGSVKEVMKAFSMLAMLDAPSTSLTDDAKAAILEKAGSVLRTAKDELTVAQGVLGAKQHQLSRAGEIQSAAATAVQKQIIALEQDDPFVTADRLKALQIQLEATYTITAQLSRLSLVNYL